MLPGESYFGGRYGVGGRSRRGTVRRCVRVCAAWRPLHDGRQYPGGIPSTIQRGAVVDDASR